MFMVETPHIDPIHTEDGCVHRGVASYFQVVRLRSGCGLKHCILANIQSQVLYCVCIP